MLEPRGFWLQHALHGADDLVAMADDLAAFGYRPGVVLSPVGSPSRLRGLYRRTIGSGSAFLDPSGFLLDRDGSPQRAANFPWLDPSYGRPSDLAGWTSWIERSLRHQLSNDLRDGADEPSIVVTASPQLKASSNRDELYLILDAATAARETVAPACECWLGIVVDRDYLRDTNRLTELADAVVTAGFPGVVFRVFQNELAPLGDRRLLEGLRELVEGCAGGDVEVFLPNGGWTGWLAGAWGASGYSGGLSKSSWYDRTPSPMASVPRRETIFDINVLRYVRWTEHEQLRLQPSYVPCGCASCTSMAGSHDADLVKLHQIRVAHAWSEESRSSNPFGVRRAVRARLDAAIDFRDGLPRTLRDRVDAGFLDTWRALV